MSRSSLKTVLVGALGVVAGLVLGLAYGHVQTQSVQKADQARIKGINQRLSQVQRRYAQEVSDRTACEDENRTGQAEFEKLRKEEEHLAAGNKTLKAEAEARAASTASQRASLEKKSRRPKPEQQL